MAKINISRRKHWKTIHPPNHKKIIRRCHQAMPYFNFNASLKTVGNLAAAITQSSMPWEFPWNSAASVLS